jgi:hypothetical protein
MHNPVKPSNGVVQSRRVAAPRKRLRARVLIPKSSPVTQIEIEVIAALLDDWESMASGISQELNK